MKRRTPLVSIALVLVLGSISEPARACPRVYSEEEISENLDEVAEQLELLWSGTTAERRAIAADAWPRFRPWQEPVPAEDRPHLAEQVETLRLWIRAEPEVELVAAVLRQVARFGLPELAPVFRELLDHPSPNLRWVAAGHFAAFRDPSAGHALSDRWRAESVERIRIDLALALACHGNADPAVTWRTWLDDDRPAFAEAALRSLAAVRDEGALAAVLRLARDAEPETRSVAVQVLPAWSGSEGVFEHLVAALGDRIARDAAIRSLAGYPDTRAADPLVELVAREPDHAWTVAIAAAGRPDGPELLRRIESVVDAETRQGWVETWGGLPSELDELPFGTGHPGAQGWTLEACGTTALHRDPRFERPLRVDAPDGRLSLRCEESPRGGGLRPLATRLPAGTDLEGVQEVVELASGTWVQGWFHRVGTCWIEASSLVDPELRDEVSDPGAVTIVEFDVPAEELASTAFAALDEAELARAHDVTSELAGIRLLADLDDPRAIAGLAGAIDDGSTFLELRVLAALAGVPADRWPDGTRDRLAHLLESPPMIRIWSLLNYGL